MLKSYGLILPISGSCLDWKILILEINFSPFVVGLYQTLDGHIHNNSEFRIPTVFSNKVETIYKDEITDIILRILEKCDTKLKKNVEMVLKKAKNVEIETLTFNTPYSATKIDDEHINLEEIIKENKHINKIKIKSSYFSEIKSIKKTDFISAIKSAPNLFGIELHESVKLTKNKYIDYIKKFYNAIKNDTEIKSFYLRYCNDKENIFVLKSSQNANDTHIISIQNSEIKISQLEGIFDCGYESALPYVIFAGELNKSILESTSKEGLSAIDMAIQKNDLLAIKYLIQKSAKFLCEKDVNTSLHCAARYADFQTFMYLLNKMDLSQFIECKDTEGNTPLCILAEKGKADTLREFIISYGANLNYRNPYARKNILELAFESAHYETVKNLLKNKAIISQELKSNFTSISKKQDHELYNFLKTINDFFDAIRKGDLDIIIEFIHNERININECVNFDNQSPLYAAVEAKQSKIYGYMISIGANFSSSELNGNPYKGLSKTEKDEFDNAILEYIKKPDDATAMHLYSLTKSRNRIKNIDILQIYKNLLNIELVKPILELIEILQHKPVILIDYAEKSTRYYSLSSSDKTMGEYNANKSRVCIGLNDSAEEMQGTIAHEFTHLASQIIFQNNGFPYLESDESKKIKYNSILEEIKEEVGHDKYDKKIDDIIRRAFKYDHKDRPAELIVRVPHMLAKYGTEEGIKKLKLQAPDLLNFYCAEFLPKCLEVIKKLQSEQVAHSQLSIYMDLKENIIHKNENNGSYSGFIGNSAKVLLGIGIGYGIYRFFKSEHAMKYCQTVISNIIDKDNSEIISHYKPTNS